MSEGQCWDTWEILIYNRWGGLVWISASSVDQWDANVATGVYVYKVTAHSSVSPQVQELTGHITVLY